MTGPSVPGEGQPVDRPDANATGSEPTAPDPAAPDSTADTASSGRSGGWLRTSAVVLLLVVGTILALLTPPVVWGRNLVLNTDRYVETLAPLASDPGVQAAVITAVDTQFAKNTDVKSLAEQVLPPRAKILAGPLASAAASLVNTVITKFVHGPRFPKLWKQINRAAHKQIVSILTNDRSGKAVQIQHDEVVLDLAPIVSQVKERAIAAGLTVASKVPPVGVTIEIAKVNGVDSARRYTELLNRVANWIPWLALAMFAGAIGLARRRRRMVVISASCIVGAMVVLGLGLNIGRHYYLNALSGTQFDAATAGDVFDTVVRFLRAGLRTVLLVALLVIVIAWLTGPSGPARKLRHGVASVPRAVTERGRNGSVGVFVNAYHAPLLVGVLALAALVLVLWTNPSTAIVLTILILAGIGVLLVESLRAKHVPAPAG